MLRSSYVEVLFLSFQVLPFRENSRLAQQLRSHEKPLKESYDPAKYNRIQLLLEFYSFTSNKNFRNNVFFHLGRNVHLVFYGALIRQAKQLL